MIYKIELVKSLALIMKCSRVDVQKTFLRMLLSKANVAPKNLTNSNSVVWEKHFLSIKWNSMGKWNLILINNFFN